MEKMNTQHAKAPANQPDADLTAKDQRRIDRILRNEVEKNHSLYRRLCITAERYGQSHPTDDEIRTDKEKRIDQALRNEIEKNHSLYRRLSIIAERYRQHHPEIESRDAATITQKGAGDALRDIGGYPKRHRMTGRHPRLLQKRAGD